MGSIVWIEFLCWIPGETELLGPVLFEKPGRLVAVAPRTEVTWGHLSSGVDIRFEPSKHGTQALAFVGYDAAEGGTRLFGAMLPRPLAPGDAVASLKIGLATQ